jgi:hypothetical protein
MLRFCAPLDDCKAFATSYCRPYVPPGVIANTWVPIVQPPEPPDLKGYRLAVEWFHIDRLKAGVTLSPPTDTCPSIWIDTNTETFYSYWTD